MLKDRWTLLAFVATALLLTGCLMPKRMVPTGERLTPRVPHQDKLVHFGMFATFGYLWARSGAPSRLSRRKAGAVLLAAAFLAVGTEWAQGLEIIHRDPDVLDALADMVGAVGGVSAFAASAAMLDGGSHLAGGD
jgi:VanZ family protein